MHSDADKAYGAPLTGMARAAVGNVAPGDTVLGRYRIVGARAGGFGTVLTCWDTRLQRRVAIKRIPLAAGKATTGEGGTGGAIPAGERHATGGTRRRGGIDTRGRGTNVVAATMPNAGRRRGTGSTMAAALAEARTASLLAHPGIVTVFDFESDADFAYLVMEHVDGLTLAELLQRVEGGTLTGDETAYVTASVAAALSYAHVNGVLHLDIKPTNIIIDAAGTVKLCDFGMATLASAAGYGGARGGTVGYMPPEQVVGSMVDERTDVFSLAVVVWQMLAGYDPFAAPTADATLRLMRRGPAHTLAETTTDVGADADEAMAAALSPEPSGRPSSVDEFAQMIGPILGDAEAGERSIAYLLTQAVSDEGDAAGDGEALPLAFRYPWLDGAITRGAALLATCTATAAPATVLLAGRPAGAVVGAVAAAGAVTALWTPAGSAIATLALAAALGRATDSVVTIMTCGITVLLATLWWAGVARRNPHATTALLAPIALRAPVAGTAIAGCYLPPARAAVTAVAAWLLAQLHAAALTSGFDAAVAMRALAGRLAGTGCWLAVTGVAVAAAAIAAITRRAHTHGGVVAGQITGALIVIATQLAASSMENADYVVSPSWSGVGVAVVLCVAMGIVTTICDATADEEEA